MFYVFAFTCHIDILKVTGRSLHALPRNRAFNFLLGAKRSSLGTLGTLGTPTLAVEYCAFRTKSQGAGIVWAAPPCVAYSAVDGNNTRPASSHLRYSSPDLSNWWAADRPHYRRCTLSQRFYRVRRRLLERVLALLSHLRWLLI